LPGRGERLAQATDRTSIDTLGVSAASTTVPAKNCGAGSVVLLSPLTAHAAAELGNGTIFVSASASGERRN